MSLEQSLMAEIDRRGRLLLRDQLTAAIDDAGIPTIGLIAMRFAVDTVTCDYADDEFTLDHRFVGTAARHDDGTMTTTYRLSALRRLDYWRQALATPRDSGAGAEDVSSPAPAHRALTLSERKVSVLTTRCSCGAVFTHPPGQLIAECPNAERAS